MTTAAQRCRACAGGATVAACLALIALLLVTVMIVQIAAVVCARHRAQSAADLGALAAASALDFGEVAACDRAESVVRGGRMRMVRCTAQGWDVAVTVGFEVSPAIVGSRSVVAVARAGPVAEENRS
ncbi:Rv3654c family TadE-like protein [Nocardia sp. NPDC052254]|uniref:Rv3654c family TadE-like protein n=1 Tax=Nocardia sp. NPDC052254 TaxID=3155681 RepID=UPI003435987C